MHLCKCNWTENPQIHCLLDREKFHYNFSTTYNFLTAIKIKQIVFLEM